MGTDLQLKVENLRVNYGPIRALKGISLEVHKGEIVALLGANGAGKTTLLQTISGMLTPVSGDIYFEGSKITKEEPEKIVRRQLIHVPEHRQVFGTLSVLDNLYLGTYHYYKRSEKKKVEKLLNDVFELFPILKSRQDQMAGTLSGGQQQMLAIARGVMAQPKVMLLDEPTLGLAPLVGKEVLELVTELNERLNMTFLLVEQNVIASLKAAHRGYVVSNGEIVKEGSASALLQDQEIKEAYLGQKIS